MRKQAFIRVLSIKHQLQHTYLFILLHIFSTRSVAEAVQGLLSTVPGASTPRDLMAFSVAYTHSENPGSWQRPLGKQLQAAGLDVMLCSGKCGGKNAEADHKLAEVRF